MIQPIAFVTGADRGLGLALCDGLLNRQWQVYAGQHRPIWPELGNLKQRFPDALQIVPLEVCSTESVAAAAEVVKARSGQIDLLINNAGILAATAPRTIRDSLDDADMQREFDVNALGPLRVVEGFLPLMDGSSFKRLCFVSSESGSIQGTKGTDKYGYCMSKAALNMGTRLLFNHLRPEGYTFRLYHPGWMRTYITSRKSTEADLEPDVAAAHALTYFLDAVIDENILVMRDWQGKEWPW